MNIRLEISQALNRIEKMSQPVPRRRAIEKRSLGVERLEDRRLLATIDLAALTSAQGSVLYGADSSDYSGFSVSNAGDVNGDGFDDLFIGANRAYAANNSKANAGESYIVFGRPSISAAIDFDNLGAEGVKIYGVDPADRSGSSVSSAGDVNGDGFDDLIIGAFFAASVGNARSRAGDSYVVYGAALLPPTIDLANLGSAGMSILGAETLDRGGTSVSGAGDVNGDGFDDLVIGAPGADALNNGKSTSGDSYLIFGNSNLPAAVDLANLGSVGVTIFGTDAADESGYFVSTAGDLNADGFDEWVIGARFADAVDNLKSGAGESYVIWGKADWSTTSTIDLASLGLAGITIFGADIGDRAGFALDSAGDVNGDGFDDLLIGAYTGDGLNNGLSNSGDTYVVYGSEFMPATIDLASLGSAGVRIHGTDLGDLSGVSVSGGGDVNGDGFDDLLIGAFNADAESNAKLNAGESYVLFGGPSLANTITLSSLSSAGMTIYGADAGDLSGVSVSLAGDFNGDGFDDLLIGAFNAGAANNLKTYAGESYFLYGGDFTASITHPGTTSNDTLNGTALPNVMNGGLANDTLLGNGGADTLIGGQGDDTLAVNDLAFKRIVGGTGHDTLRLDGSGLSLNLTNVRDNRILDIEEIDISGGGGNTLILNQREVLNLSGFKNSLVVRRNADDVVITGGGWIPGGFEIIGGNNFEVFTQEAATLKLQVVSSAIVNRQIFYNRSPSTLFGDGTGNPVNAIDATKSALLPGQTTSSANYTNYSKGLNGLIVDITNLPGIPTSSDFQFATWDGIDPGGFTASEAVSTITVLPGVGVSGSSRIKIEFGDGVIRNTWLRVTLLANASTGLSSNDVFYFGNAVAEMYIGNVGTPTTLRTNATDTSVVRQSQSIAANSVGVTSIHDVNKDGRVNATDTSIVRQNQNNSIMRFFDAPSSLMVSESSIAVDMIMADSGWMDGLDPLPNKRRAGRSMN